MKVSKLIMMLQFYEQTYGEELEVMVLRGGDDDYLDDDIILKYQTPEYLRLGEHLELI